MYYAQTLFLNLMFSKRYGYLEISMSQEKNDEEKVRGRLAVETP